MWKSVLTLMLAMILFSQGFGKQKLQGVTVHTQYSPSIVFEYAYAVLHQDETVTDQQLQELRSNLMATGLFAKVSIKMNRNAEGFVEVAILPTWRMPPQKFVVGEIRIKGFDQADQLKAIVQRRLAPSAPLLRTCQRVKPLLLDAGEEIYRTNPQSLEQYERLVSRSSYKIERLSSRRFRLVITLAEG